MTQILHPANLKDNIYPFQHVFRNTNGTITLICENFAYRAECTVKNRKLKIIFQHRDGFPELTFHPATPTNKARLGFICTPKSIQSLLNGKNNTYELEAITFLSGLTDILRDAFTDAIFRYM